MHELYVLVTTAQSPLSQPHTHYSANFEAHASVKRNILCSARYSANYYVPTAQREAPTTKPTTRTNS